MLDSFIAYIRQEEICLPGDRILVAVSGGPDSVLLAFLLRTAGYEIGLAHCNFQLRGQDSDADEALAQTLAAEWQVPFYREAFATSQIAGEQRKTIQETARDLRYHWLERVRQKEGYDWIATGHHLDDSIETLLFNLTKGCGIRGLHGISPRRGSLIRPLLFAEKSQILAFLESAGIPFREDLSNRQRYYDRNKIRLEVIPVLESINPGLKRGFSTTIRHIREAEMFYDFAIEEWRKRVVMPAGVNGFLIRWDELKKCPAPATLLYEIAAPFGFRSGPLELLAKQASLASGRQWLSSTHRLLSGREELLLEPLPQEGEPFFVIEKGTESLSLPEGTLTFQFLEQQPPGYPTSGCQALLDAEALEFPLLLRHWKPGDYFHPLGLEGRKKKLQDFFTDLKMPVWEKEQTWILESAGQIAWIVGRRIDETFKIKPDSTTCWLLSFDRNL